MSSYRNTRREQQPADLRTLVTEVDRVVSEYAEGNAFVTGLFAQLDVTVQRVSPPCGSKAIDAFPRTA